MPHENERQLFFYIVMLSATVSNMLLLDSGTEIEEPGFYVGGYSKDEETAKNSIPPPITIRKTVTGSSTTENELITSVYGYDTSSGRLFYYYMLYNLPLPNHGKNISLLDGDDAGELMRAYAKEKLQTFAHFTIDSQYTYKQAAVLINRINLDQTQPPNIFIGSSDHLLNIMILLCAHLDNDLVYMTRCKYPHIIRAYMYIFHQVRIFVYEGHVFLMCTRTKKIKTQRLYRRIYTNGHAALIFDSAVIQELRDKIAGIQALNTKEVVHSVLQTLTPRGEH